MSALRSFWNDVVNKVVETVDDVKEQVSETHDAVQEEVTETYKIGAGTAGLEPEFRKGVSPDVKEEVTEPYKDGADIASLEPEYKPPVEEKQPTLRKGDKSADGWVEYLQQMLNKRLNPSPNLKEDGDFGPATLKAVLAYQQQEGIQKDGVVGNQTWAALRGAKPEKPSTDQRVPHTFVDKLAKARWQSEREIAVYTTSSDEMTLAAVSVGQTPSGQLLKLPGTSLTGAKVNLFVTAPGSERKRDVVHVGPPTHRTETDEGNQHHVIVANFTKRFPSTPPGANVAGYLVEAFFDQAQGGDGWTSKNSAIIVR